MNDPKNRRNPVATPVLKLYAEGPFALFTSPAFKIERVTYDVMTPSAAVGLVSAILWKPAVRIQIERIDVCAPIRRATMTLNGVSRKISSPKPKHMDGTADPFELVLDATANRLQSRETLLMDVRYVVHFRYVMTDKAGRGDTPTKFEEMFERRLERGQFFHLPHFGLQQHIADCRPVLPTDVPLLDENRDLGMMPHHRIYGEDSVETIWFHARLVEGVMWVPAPEDVRHEDPHAEQGARHRAQVMEHDRETRRGQEFVELERRQRLEREELERMQAAERAEFARKQAAAKDRQRSKAR